MGPTRKLFRVESRSIIASLQTAAYGVSPAAPRPREGRLTEPTAGAQRRSPERVLMPRSGHCMKQGSSSRLMIVLMLCFGVADELAAGLPGS
jgi:hypothetical protein